MLFAFICLDKPNSADLRLSVRAEHIEYMIAVKDRTVFGGPLLDEAAAASIGSIFAIEFESYTAARQFIDKEPYTQKGLFASVQIFPWKQMVPEREEGFLLAELERQRILARSAGEIAFGQEGEVA